MITKILVQQICIVFKLSEKMVHFLIILLGIIIISISEYFCFPVIEKSQLLTILSGLSVLASFFIFAVQNIDYKFLNTYFTKHEKINKSTSNTQAAIIRNTIFSFFIMVYSLIGVSFLLSLYNKIYYHLLIFIVLYLFIGLFYVLVIWNYIASKVEDK